MDHCCLCHLLYYTGAFPTSPPLIFLSLPCPLWCSSSLLTCFLPYLLPFLPLPTALSLSCTPLLLPHLSTTISFALSLSASAHVSSLSMVMPKNKTRQEQTCFCLLFTHRLPNPLHMCATHLHTFVALPALPSTHTHTFCTASVCVTYLYKRLISSGNCDLLGRGKWEENGEGETRGVGVEAMVMVVVCLVMVETG